MYPILFHIWGPFAIHSYGAMIALGNLTAFYLALKDTELKNLISSNELTNATTVLILSGIIGGRLLHIAENWESVHSLFDAINITDAGFSLLGTIICGAVAVTAYLHSRRLQILLIADRIVIYLPLMYSIARLGCFFTGCCYGQKTSAAWAITYTNQEVLAPCFTPLHPTQLYSTVAGFFIFLCMYFLISQRFRKQGQLVGFYFIATGLERFFVDIFRGDRIMATTLLSTSQMIAIFCILMGAVLFYSATSHLLTDKSKR